MSTPNSTNLTAEEFTQSLIQFINQELSSLHPKLSLPEPIHSITPLFENGLIDSLGIIYLVGFVEKALNQDLSLQDINMKNFRTVAQISQLYASKKK
jgi:acyl carrier protein